MPHGPIPSLPPPAVSSVEASLHAAPLVIDSHFPPFLPSIHRFQKQRLNLLEYAKEMSNERKGLIL